MQQRKNDMRSRQAQEDDTREHNGELSPMPAGFPVPPKKQRARGKLQSYKLVASCLIGLILGSLTWWRLNSRPGNISR
ncbi:MULTISPECIES: hypothetical protein [Limnospira]|uniref:Uncharacterized protein n=3 Tax=Limnospira platensis TaxID=118562 RepID=A0A5M3T433_LIMPL|nr:hypothetical protein AP285_19760 [Arthrospira platensis YZ]KDR54210.1 hypothetical protein APPUASWS_029475 [Arthrospira platensis str. Paraca]MBD2712234.1 hypothetical protein [Arthrospira platensis FACHB-835]MDT9185785.1 hypothetical protein [Limnospira sp. PMC 289.06]MDT9313453.1 hypothetical protein [Limnospira sp. Paracas R14]BAI92322.1 hypothetical protein NIES39_L01610 [Arthrospira platensis NIES-39]GCE92269.1 hypothetical protein NIES46_03070 [Arthrospira platensis NIES-46]